MQIVDNTIKIQMTDVWDSPKEPENNSPVLDYCRKLIKEEVDPNTRLEVYRGEMLALVINNIGEGAEWTIKENNKVGPKFVKYRPFPTNKLRGISSTVSTVR